MSVTYITSFVHIKNHQVYLNGDLLFEDEKSNDFATFIRNIYKLSEMNYAKFYKMDDLSKLALVGAEFLLSKKAIHYLPNEKSIILNNKSASLDTDFKHQKAINEGLASPAIFVYTLPNICIGEMAIKHKIMGENTFLVAEEFDIENIFRITDILHQEGKTKITICGWVEYFQEEYELFLYLVEQNPEIAVSSIKKMPIFASLIQVNQILIHHPNNIKLLYNN